VLILTWCTKGYGGFGGGGGLPGGKAGAGSKPGYPTGTGVLCQSYTIRIIVIHYRVNLAYSTNTQKKLYIYIYEEFRCKSL